MSLIQESQRRLELNRNSSPASGALRRYFSIGSANGSSDWPGKVLESGLGVAEFDCGRPLAGDSLGRGRVPAAVLEEESRPIRSAAGTPGARPKRIAGRGERGQAMTEYLFLVVLCGLVCIPVVRWLPSAVRGYIRPFYYCISRPIP